MKTGVTFTGKEVFGERLTLLSAKALLGTLDQTSVLRLCAWLNALNQISAYQFRCDGYRTPEAEVFLKWLLKELLHPDYWQRALEEIYRKSAPHLFSPLNGAAINGVIGLACRWCPKKGGDELNTIERVQKVTQVIFALQGAMLDKKIASSIGDMAGLRASFPFLARNILANQAVKMEHDLGRLHAFASVPEVGASLKRELNVEKPIEKWFAHTFGLPVLAYQCIFTALSGYAGAFFQNRQLLHLHLHLDVFLNSLNYPPGRVEELLRLAQTTPEQVVAGTPEPKEMADAVFFVDHLLVYPLLQIDNFYLVTSFEAVFSKFVRGLPYLSFLMAEQKKAAGSASVVKGARSGFGYIFEGYAGWLAHQWFDGSNVRIIQDYRVQLPSHKKGDGFAQRDLLLIRNDVGYVIETKAKVPTRQLRRTGDLEQIVKMVLPLNEDGGVDRSGLVAQAHTAAEALVAGRAFLSDGKTQIPPLKRVFPIGLVFEDLPLRSLIAKPFEMDIEQAYGAGVFHDSGKIAPIQFFDIQTFEEWDVVFDMPSETGLLLVALEKRAYNEILRYENLESIHGCRRGNWRAKPGLLDKLASESEDFVKANCQFLKLANTTRRGKLKRLFLSALRWVKRRVQAALPKQSV